MTTLLITGGRDYCEYLDANGFPIQIYDDRSRVTGVKTREAAISERRALGFALDFAFKWSGADKVEANNNTGTGRWARIWAEKRGVRSEYPDGLPKSAVVFPCADPRAVQMLTDAGVDIFEVKE